MRPSHFSVFDQVEHARTMWPAHHFSLDRRRLRFPIGCSPVTIYGLESIHVVWSLRAKQSGVVSMHYSEKSYG